MKNMKLMYSFLPLIFFSFVCVLHAQPNIPKENIPRSIPSDLRFQIEKLYSVDPIERAYAARSLGERGKLALPAIPFLIAILHDNASLKYGIATSVTLTSPGAEAADALAKMGKEVVAPLINALKNENVYGQREAARALGILKSSLAIGPLIEALANDDFSLKDNAAWALKKITGQDFGKDRSKWQTWWGQNKQ
jgi:HEAT repeat protein